MVRDVDELLFSSRLPNRFFELVTGESSVYKNPGKSLMSYVIAKAVTGDKVIVPTVMEGIVHECEIFTGDPFITGVIIEKLTEKIGKLSNEAGEFRSHSSSEIVDLEKAIARMASLADHSLQQYKLYYAQGGFVGQPAELKLFRQTLFDLQDTLLDIEWRLAQPSIPDQSA